MTTTADQQQLAGLIAAQRPGWTLDRAFYLDLEIYDCDVECVYAKSWLYAGHVAQIPRPGDYFLYRIGDESLIVIRGDEGRIHALFNVCRHRGSAICTEESGHSPRLICPYHQWAYRTDGSLQVARLMPPDFDESAFGLLTAPVRVCDGLIFIHLTDGLPGFDPFFDQVSPRLRCFDLASAKIAHTENYQVHANWKLVLENSRECYHCGAGHPQYCKAVGFAAGVASETEAEQNRIRTAAMEERLRRIGLETPPIPYGPGTWFHSRRFFLRDGFVTESMDGRPVAPLLGSIPERDVGVLALVALPNLMFEASSDYVMITRWTPAGPRLTHVQVQWLVRGGAQQGADYEIGPLTEFWRLTSEQDWKLCEDNQAGVNSRHYQRGIYTPQEKGVMHFVDWYLNKIRGQGTGFAVAGSV